ncbi:hypothetical protein EBS43_10790 [bacterium]|nr:hypothetical protein [bacterium]
MEFKNLMTLSTIIVTGWYLQGGTAYMNRKVHEARLYVLREIVSTKNWAIASPHPVKQRVKKKNLNHLKT